MLIFCSFLLPHLFSISYPAKYNPFRLFPISFFSMCTLLLLDTSLSLSHFLRSPCVSPHLLDSCFLYTPALLLTPPFRFPYFSPMLLTPLLLFPFLSTPTYSHFPFPYFIPAHSPFPFPLLQSSCSRPPSFPLLHSSCSPTPPFRFPSFISPPPLH